MHSGKVILITGGTGQVGTAAAAALLRRGWKVRVLTRDSSSAKADALRTMGARMSSAAILTTGKALHRAMAGVLLCSSARRLLHARGIIRASAGRLEEYYDDGRVEYHVP